MAGPRESVLSERAENAAEAAEGVSRSANPAPLAVLVTAAGRSERFGGGKKEIFDLAGRTVLFRAVSAFSRIPGLAALVITAPDGFEGRMREALASETISSLEKSLGDRFAVALGGPTRRDSVRLGLEALVRVLATREASLVSPASLPEEIQDMVVLVHDGARPWVSQGLAERVAAVAGRVGACVPVTHLIETPKEISSDGIVVRHPSRSTLATAQTPQGFRLGPLLAAHRRAAEQGVDCTDDAELWARYNGPVAWTEGERANRKITFREDLNFTPGGFIKDDITNFLQVPEHFFGREKGGTTAPFRVGEGWDIHRLIPGRKLYIGGVEIPSDKGEEGHSDGDVLLHAVIDALLGSAALGDIGQHFPPTDDAWKGADSRDLARRALSLVREAGWTPVNLDCTVILERPMLAPHREAIRESLAKSLEMDVDSISIKAKTKEGVDATGEGKAVEARAIVLVTPR